MKKFFNTSIMVVMVLFIALANTFTAAEAKSLNSASGSWNMGTEVKIDLLANPAPAWLQSFGKGVAVTTPGKICHNFSVGQFKWIAEIRQLVNGKWAKVPTTQGWMPSEEGAYMACAQADTAGTYALFGYYTGPVEIVGDQTPPTSPVCSTMPFTMNGYIVHYIGEGYEFEYDFEFSIDPLTLPKTFTFSILSYTPTATGPVLELKGSATKTFIFSSMFKWTAQSDGSDIEPIRVRIETDTCHVDLDLTEIKD